MYKGYAVDQQRFIDNDIHYKSFTSTVRLIADLVDRKQLSAEESTGLLKIISKYAYALETLDWYDQQTLTITNITKDDKQVRLEYEDAMREIKKLPDYGKSQWFGNEKDNSFHGALNAIYQTAFGEDLYPSVEEEAELGVVLNHVILDQDLPIKIHGLEKYSQDRMHQSEQDQIVFDDRQVKRVKH